MNIASPRNIPATIITNLNLLPTTMASRGRGRFQSSGRSSLGSTGVVVDKEVLARRAARFSVPTNPMKSKSVLPRNSAASEQDFEEQLVGTCELLEKCYLRLTTAPDESEVRPHHVLVKSLDRVKELWENGSEYKRVSELLKSIRQDMTVQGIQDKLSIDVYETNARIALQAYDHSEFNVCLSVLMSLYDNVNGGAVHKDEFTAYKLLYYIFTKDLADLEQLIMKLTERSKSWDCSIVHAMKVVMAWYLGLYNQIFLLYSTAPAYSSLVMDLFLPRERSIYFNVIIKAYRPSVPIELITTELQLKDKINTQSFLDQLKYVIYTDASKSAIDCKATLEKSREM